MSSPILGARRLSSVHAAARQGGVVLFIALIMLVAMTMAGLALMRGIGSGLGITSNLAFKQVAGAQADLGIENARTWLVAQLSSENLNADLTASAYYSFWDPNFSPATFDWENNSRLILAADANGNITGNEVRIVTHRLCESPGLSVQNVLQKCVVVNPDAVSGRAGGSKGGGGAGGTGGDGGGYSSAGISEEPPPYYRVTARVRGPRNTISYTQVIMY